MNVKQITRYSILLAIAVILNWVEHLIPIASIPGVRLGLANAIGFLCLYYLGYKAYSSFGLLRVLLASLLFGTFLGTSFWISLGGCVLVTITTIILTKFSKVSIYGVSIASAIMHGLGQVLVVALLYQTGYIISYVLILSITGAITGALVAYLSTLIIKRLPNRLIKKA
ncbi:MAG: Gx transporter family protein [Bacilli bacterium]|nr:Gx transporter family protein [Bacilli bacterium]